MKDDLFQQPILIVLEERYGTPLVEADYVLEATPADAVSAVALEVPQGSPLFVIERMSYTSGRRPVDYERLSYRGDFIRFGTRLSRRRSPPESTDA